MPANTASRIIAKHLCRVFPGTVYAGYGLVCKPSPIHFIEGVQIDGARLKGEFYFWSVMSPMWSPNSQPILNYSDRLSVGAIGGPPQALAEQVAELFQADPTYRNRLIAPETSVEDFLATKLGNVPPTWPTPSRGLHRGLALACLGRVKEAHEYVAADLAGKIPGFTSPFHKRIVAIRDSLAAGDGNHLRLIAAMEAAAAAERGLTRPADEPNITHP